MRSVLAVVSGFLLLLLAMPACAEEPLAVITQKSSLIKNLSLDEIKRIYLRTSLLDTDGARWIPLNLPVESELRQHFSLTVFKTTPEDQEQYWNEQYFQGNYPPEVLASEEAVIRFIEITPGAIGYIYKHHLDRRVKAVAVLGSPAHR